MTSERAISDPGAVTNVASPRRWGLLALLITGMVFCFAHRNTLNVAAPLMRQELGLRPDVMGLLFAAFTWPYALGQAPSGWIVDRFGYRRAYAIAYAVWSLATAGLGVARNVWSLAALRMLAGTGQSMIFPASARAAATNFPDRERGVATSTFISGNRLGIALINGVGTLLLLRVGWKDFFLLAGLVPLLWLGPWLWFTARDQKHVADNAMRAPAGFSFGESLRLLRHRSMLGIFLGFSAYDYTWFLLLNWLPGYLVMERGFTAGEMAVYSSMPYLVSFFVTILTGIASDWFVRRGYNELRVRRNFIMAGMAIASVLMLVGVVEDKMTAVWLLVVAVGGLSIAAPMAWTLTQTVCDKRIVGTASGLQNFGGNLAGTISPALTGFIVQRTGSFMLALGLAGVLLLVGILAYALLVREPIVMKDEG